MIAKSFHRFRVNYLHREKHFRDYEAGRRTADGGMPL